MFFIQLQIPAKLLNFRNANHSIENTRIRRKRYKNIRWEISEYLGEPLEAGCFIRHWKFPETQAEFLVELMENTCGFVTPISLIIRPNSPQIHAASPFRCWGFSVPQTSVDPSVLCRATEAVSDACKLRGIVGYFSIDFVTFIDPKSVGTCTLTVLSPTTQNKLNKPNSGSNNDNTR